MSTDGDTVLELLECLEVQDGAGRLQQLALLQVTSRKIALSCMCMQLTLSCSCATAGDQRVISKPCRPAARHLPGCHQNFAEGPLSESKCL